MATSSFVDEPEDYELEATPDDAPDAPDAQSELSEPRRLPSPVEFRRPHAEIDPTERSLELVFGLLLAAGSQVLLAGVALFVSSGTGQIWAAICLLLALLAAATAGVAYTRWEKFSERGELLDWVFTAWAGLSGLAWAFWSSTSADFWVIALAVAALGVLLFAAAAQLAAVIAVGVGMIIGLAISLVLEVGGWSAPAIASGVVLALAGAALTYLGWLRVERKLHLAAEWRVEQGTVVEAKSRIEGLLDDLAQTQEQRREAERELGMAKDMADSAARAKTEFLATMSHEIRTPLNGILPILEILRDSELDEEQQNLVSTAYSSSRHLLRIINDILDFSKAESGKLELESIEMDLPEVVGSVGSLMRRGAEQRGLKLITQIDKDVPPYVRGDPIRLRQVLTNLLGNAIKFTQKGHIRVIVSKRRVSRKEIELMFSVQDSGIGMSRSTQRRLFSSFTQADASTTRKHGGTGLGLAICKRLVDLMGGKIGVRSRLGEGSTFWFVLPMRKSTRDMPAARKSLQKARVLTLVEEEEDAKELSEWLQEWEVVEERTDDMLDAFTKLKSSAMLGSSWAYELLLIDTKGMDPAATAILKEIKKTDSLVDLKVLVSSRSAYLLKTLRERPGIHLMEGPLRKQQLKRRMHRLLDVETEEMPPTSGEGEESQLHDLNLELAVMDFDESEKDKARPLAKVDKSERLQGNVLLVEDNPINLRVARKLLVRLGLTCEVANDGKEALQKLDQESFDVVLMDCQMPVMDGYEATRNLRNREKMQSLPHTPVVAMTANAMAGDRQKCLNAGMDDYLSKPINLDGLRGMLTKWLAQTVDTESLVLDSAKAWRPPNPELFKRLEKVLPEVVADTDQSDDDVQPAPESDAEVKIEVDSGPISDEAPTNVIDREQLRELEEIMEDEFTELLVNYIKNAPTLVAEVKQAVVDKNLEEMVRPAHSLKSSSANVGANRLSEIAKTIEHAARRDDYSTARASYKGLREEFRMAIAELKAIVTEHG